MSTVVVEQFDSAKDAFRSLNIGNKFDKRHAVRRCKAVEKLLNNGAWTKYAKVSDYCMIFKSHLSFFHKTIKMGQVNGTDTLAVFCDQYSEYCMAEFVSTCAAGGISIVPFVKKYPETYGTDDFIIDTKTVKMECTGYKNLYRGNLCGFYF